MKNVPLQNVPLLPGWPLKGLWFAVKTRESRDHCTTVQCSTVQCSTVQCSTVQHSGHLVVQPQVLGEAVAQEDETPPLLPLPVVAVQLLGPPVGQRGGGGDDPAHHTRDT